MYINTPNVFFIQKPEYTEVCTYQKTDQEFEITGEYVFYFLKGESKIKALLTEKGITL